MKTFTPKRSKKVSRDSFVLTLFFLHFMACHAPPAGEGGGPGAGTLCGANEYVSSNICTTCPAGTTNAANDDASGADTSCDATDPDPNALPAQVIRADTSQTGSTTDTATFTYSCNNGYQLVRSATTTFTCTGTGAGTSAWQGGTIPTCAAVSCDEANDPQPNTLSAQVIRTDSGQTGTTTATATFTYSCNNGYQVVGSPTTTFTCTATGVGTSAWQGGTVPTCTDQNQFAPPLR
uniref:Sushi domain-containing protein n=1 Tax=Chromera velia CCMP2878 TaxID=1169474 RepID=A0A0G4HL75_9ALVE|eukprot:Cvel_7318.t1-p1 / transcript=Cvel_7318.t1 / gene=Cvel_7318 / organism=Chromera_velia_CCMP2878 / gene_product=hypothetical protein / transcript_product=hypothetical protein / location=Cvel_scaffold379:52228-54903(+) / protein_length=234 / sequence_SO=supercontig / SO=protein_coding / is_pseudo=false